MAFTEPPATAAWQHCDARAGFEVVFFRRRDWGYRLEGHAVAVERGDAWAVRYSISVGWDWQTRRAWVAGQTAGGAWETELEATRPGMWNVDGKRTPELDGCLDVDLEASALTNGLPVHRLGLEPGDEAKAPAAYVRALDLRVGHLEQHYRRLEDQDGFSVYRYRAPAFNFEGRLTYDGAGLVQRYPGLAVRVG